MSKMKFKMFMLALPVSMMGSDKQLAPEQNPVGQPNAAAQQPLVQPANSIVQAVVVNPPIQPVAQQPNQPGDANNQAVQLLAQPAPQPNPAPQPDQDAAHQQQQAPQPEANTSSAQQPAQQEQQKPYYRNSGLIVTNCEFFYEEKDTQNKAEFIKIMNSFIEESDQLLKECDALQRFNSYYNERITKIKEIAETQAKGDETLKEKMIKALKTTLDSDPHPINVYGSYRKLYDYEVASVRTSNETLQKKVEGLEQDVKQKDTEIEALKKQLEESKESLEASRKETSDAQNALNQSKAEAANWQQKMSVADQELGQQKQQINELTNKESEAHKEIIRLNEEIKKALETNHANELKNKDLEHQITLGQTKMAHELQLHQQEVKNYQTKIAELEAKLKQQENDFSSLLLKAQEEKKTAEKDAYNRGKVDQLAANQNLVQQLQAMIMSAQQPALLAPQTQAQNQTEQMASQGLNNTNEPK